MLTKNDLQKLSQIRLEDSILLLGSGKSSSAYYLAGYSIELSLKACISKLFQPSTIPDKAFVNTIYTHSLEDLLKASGLLPEYKRDASVTPQFAAYWGIVTKWNESSRYQFWDPISAATLVESISEPNYGVFQWMKKHW